MTNVSILGGDFTVYFTDDASGDKQISWTGSATGTRTVNELYSALEDLFDNNTAGVGDYMDEGIPMRGVTPVEYLIGRIETNDPEPWYIDPESVKHLTNGSIDTTGWTRVTGTDIGIVRITYTIGTDFSASDVGKVVVSSAGDSGKLLYFDGTYAWIRPDDELAANDFDSGTVTVTAGSAASVTITANDTGETVWANTYTLGGIEDYVRLYVAQDNVEIDNWWGEGHFDILIMISELDTLIDNGDLTIYARQGTKFYDHFIINVSEGGRNAIPLATGPDTNNLNGYRSVPVSSATTTFTTGELVTGGTNGGQGVVTLNVGDPTTSFEYYLVSDVTQDFTNGETLTGDIAGANGTAGTPSSTGASGYSDVTVTFGWNNTFDIDNDLTNESYSAVINCNSRPLSEVYERLKYITRRGETATLNGIEGQQYIGIDYRVDYLALTGTILTGDTVTQSVLSGTATVSAEVVGHNTTDNYLMLRDTRGGIIEFGTGAANLQKDGSNYVTMTSTATAKTIAPIKVSPFGTLAGGRFFGARGIVLDNVATSDINNYEVIADDGMTYAEPIQVSFSLTGLETDTEVRIYNSLTNREITGTEGTESILAGAVVQNGGTGYTVNDVLTLQGGTFTTAAQVTVTSVDGGVITGISISNPGSGYSVNPSNPVSVTGGTGNDDAKILTTFKGDFSYQYIYTTDITVYIVIFHLFYKEIRLIGLTLGDENQAIPVQQNTDRVYFNP